MVKIWLSFFLLVVSNVLHAQNFDVEVGPIYGHYTDSTKHFWMLVKPHNPVHSTVDWVTQFNADFYQYIEQNTDTRVRQILRSAVVEDIYVMVTGIVDLKRPQMEREDVSFLLGSCAFPYPWAFWSGKKRDVIFKTMTRHDKDFMVWMGDNVYYLFGDWKSKKRMHRKNLKMRFKPHLRSLLESCPQYATWDDHDYGDNNGDGSYNGKYESLDMFQNYWANPYYGLDTAAGVFCNFQHSDAEFFMLDTRFYASDSSMLGTAQTDWLKAKLKASKANFKFIVSGTQVLPDNPNGEDLGDFGESRHDLLDFIKKEGITGIIFLSGDRHYGELMRMERPDTYPLYEMTSSPLTSIVNPAVTKDNAIRMPGTLVKDLNFGKIYLFGKGEERRCRMELFDRYGKLYWQHDIFLSDLQ